MTDQQDLITPPPDLVEQWLKEFYGAKLQYVAEASIHLAARAAQWGADQELEACCEWLVSEGWFKYEHEAVEDLRAARRPKPPSLKEQALEALDEEQAELSIQNYKLIRAVLESLPDHE